MSPKSARHTLEKIGGARHGGTMSGNQTPPTREERLAAKLRENLHRRKRQARAAQHRDGDENAPLPKEPPKS